mgnify:CR=1 FL=1|jgi:hypothetical protein|tara:strand:+ start:16388 stop:16612 length:225 start_codon:yes stop_codon:yes gene_type:complete
MRYVQLGKVPEELTTLFDDECTLMGRTRISVLKQLMQMYIDGYRCDNEIILMLKQKVKELEQWKETHDKHHGFK